MWWAIACASLLLIGCGDDDDGAPGDGDADADTDADTDGDGDAEWTVEDVDDGDAGFALSLAVSATGEVGIAYYPLHASEEGDPCSRWELRFAHGTPGAMDVEVVDTSPFLLAPQGVTLRYQGDTPQIVAQAGEADPDRPEYCGANDLYAMTRTAAATWTRDLVAADSGETAPTAECVAAQTSTFGWVVGTWPAIAIDPAGQMAVAWRDTHAGATLQSKDILSSDLESAIGGPGAWDKEMIDCGTGAGEDTMLAWGPDGTLVASWYTSPADSGHQGVWVGRREGPATWEKQELYSGEVVPRPSMAVAADGTVGVVWSQDQMMRYASIAPGQPLADAVIEPASPASVNAGWYSSLAFLPDGAPMVAHYRCNRYTNDGGGVCDPAEDSPVLSRKTAEGWQSEDVPTSDDFVCGAETQVGVLPDGRIVVAFVCQTRDAASGTFGSVLRLASRPAY